jgi:hypothetical protein
VVLCLIKLYFNFDRQHRTQVFNKIFADDLRTRDIKTGLQPNALDSQYDTLKRNMDPIWIDVHEKAPFLNEHPEFSCLLEKIRLAANEIDIALREKGDNNTDTNTDDYGYRPLLEERPLVQDEPNPFPTSTPSSPDLDIIAEPSDKVNGQPCHLDVNWLIKGHVHTYINSAQTARYQIYFSDSGTRSLKGSTRSVFLLLVPSAMRLNQSHNQGTINIPSSKWDLKFIYQSVDSRVLLYQPPAVRCIHYIGF